MTWSCLFTWSNERSHPTLERIERMFVSSCWNVTFTRAALQALSSRFFDHAPLLLLLDDRFHPKCCFRFQAFGHSSKVTFRRWSLRGLVLGQT
jgi:hypothetical protein